jgi:hypothetical protein
MSGIFNLLVTSMLVKNIQNLSVSTFIRTTPDSLRDRMEPRYFELELIALFAHRMVEIFDTSQHLSSHVCIYFTKLLPKLPPLGSLGASGAALTLEHRTPESSRIMSLIHIFERLRFNSIKWTRVNTLGKFEL